MKPASDFLGRILKVAKDLFLGGPRRRRTGQEDKDDNPAPPPEPENPTPPTPNGGGRPDPRSGAGLQAILRSIQQTISEALRLSGRTQMSDIEKQHFVEPFEEWASEPAKYGEEIKKEEGVIASAEAEKKSIAQSNANMDAALRNSPPVGPPPRPPSSLLLVTGVGMYLLAFGPTAFAIVLTMTPNVRTAWSASILIAILIGLFFSTAALDGASRVNKNHLLLAALAVAKGFFGLRLYAGAGFLSSVAYFLLDLGPIVTLHVIGVAVQGAWQEWTEKMQIREPFLLQKESNTRREEVLDATIAKSIGHIEAMKSMDLTVEAKRDLYRKTAMLALEKQLAHNVAAGEGSNWAEIIERNSKTGRKAS